VEGPIKSCIALILTFLFSSTTWALEETVFKEEAYSVPERELAIIAGKQGYYPEHISVFAGEKVRFFFSTVSKESSCLILKDHDLYLSAGPQEVASSEMVFVKPGVYDFFCPKGEIKGKISVLLKQKRQPERKVASEKKSRIWKPKEDSLLFERDELEADRYIGR